MKNIDEILSAVGATAEFLFSGVTDLHQRGSFGDTPLHVVCSWGDLDAVDTLIQAGADVNAIGELGKTPLFSAVIGESIEITKRLLAAGADPLIKDDDNRTVLDFARNVEDESNPITTALVELLKTVL